MEKFLVIVEFTNSELEITKKVYEYLKTKGNCLQLTSHSYLLSTSTTALELRDDIKGLGDGIQSVFVSRVSSPAAWFRSLSENSDIKALYHE